jgi:hypothetical protein
MPQRGDEPTEVRVSITVSLPVAEIITRAAEHVHASEPMFIIGATLAHIGRLKACFKAIHADTPEEALDIRAALEKIKLPPHYQYPPKRVPWLGASCRGGAAHHAVACGRSMRLRTTSRPE